MKRVAVTTSADRAALLGAALAAAGLEPVELPCITVESADDEALGAARRACNDADLIVLTSARSLRLLWPDGSPPPAPCAVVGAATAQAVTARNGTVMVCGNSGAGGLMGEIEGIVAGKRVVFPHAAGTDPSLPNRLCRAGASLVAIPVYQTIPMAPGQAPVDAVAFVAPSTVSGWLLSRSLSGLAIGAIGSTTADALRERGYRPDVVAPTPAYRSLAEALADHLEEAA